MSDTIEAANKNTVKPISICFKGDYERQWIESKHTGGVFHIMLVNGKWIPSSDDAGFTQYAKAIFAADLDIDFADDETKDEIVFKIDLKDVEVLYFPTNEQKLAAKGAIEYIENGSGWAKMPMTDEIRTEISAVVFDSIEANMFDAEHDMIEQMGGNSPY